MTVDESLALAAPNGVDCYLDTVGGQMTVDVMKALNLHGRWGRKIVGKRIN